MALSDSAQPYQATIRRISAKDGFLSVIYSADSSYADSNTTDYALNITNIPASSFSDSLIQSRIKQEAPQVFRSWDRVTSYSSDLDSIGFNDSGYAGTQYNFTYKPTVYSSVPDYNEQTHKLQAYDSESDAQITRLYSVVALTDQEKREVRENYSIDKEGLHQKLLRTGNLVKVYRKLGSGDDVSASWDASAGAAFDFNTDGIASYGVSAVERVAEGTYRVVFADAYDDGNYTVTTGVGADNYGGAGSSPRQLAVISRAADSLQVHCERTDDAVDEDNAYMAVQISKPGTYDSAEVEFHTATNNPFDGALLQGIKSILGYASDSSGDSDFLTYLLAD